MRDQNGLGIMFLFMLIRYIREIAIAVILLAAAALVWGITWLLSGP